MPPTASSKLRHRIAGAGARRRAGSGRYLPDLVGVLGDLFIAWDFIAVLTGGYVTWLLCQRFGATEEVLLRWAAVRPDVVLGSLGASLMLREPRAAWTAGSYGASSVLPRALGRVAILLGVIWGVEIVSRTGGDLPLRWLLLWSFAIVALTLQPRDMLMRALRRLERDGVLVHSVAVIGAGPTADRLMRQLRNGDGPAVEIVGLFDDRAERVPSGSVMPGGSVEELIALVQTRRVDWVVITLPWTAEARVEQILNRVKALAVEVTLCPPLLGTGRGPTGTSAGAADVLRDLPVAMLARRPLRYWSVLLKEMEDRVLAGLMLLLLLPVLALLALAVRLDSPGPILFRQPRVGLNNRPFEIFKFRSMCWQPDAPAEIVQTRREDDRVTAVGRYLRKTSLDELPQLFNVLRGEMSLVGPRPHAVTMRTQDLLGDEIIEQYKHRHRMKPGITGWAQIHGLRGAAETVEQLRARVDHDLWYIDHWSLWLDVRILLVTPVQILIGENAF